MDTFLQWLAGSWFIICTNFPMWMGGDKLSPSFTYTVQTRKGKPVLLDEVKYVKHGKTKTITGYDHPDEKDEHAFTWRGKGLLFIAKSNWRVSLMDPKGEWAVVWFSKTLFTPEGVDIICRNDAMSAAELEKIKQQMLADPVLKKHVPSLITLKK